MGFALRLGIVGAAQLFLAARGGAAAALWLWSGLSFLTVAWAYARRRPDVFAKQADGRLPIIRTCLLLPFHAAIQGVWRLHGWLGWDRVADEVSPGIWLGRWPRPQDVPHDVLLIVDLTAELPARRTVLHGREYWLVPTLDGAAPDLTLLRNAVARAVDRPGPMYVHCAQGRGRSTLFVLLLLRARGIVPDLEEAERVVRAVRPSISLTRAQRRLLADARDD